MTDRDCLIRTKQILTPRDNLTNFYNKDINMNYLLSKSIVKKNIIDNEENEGSHNNSFTNLNPNNNNSENRIDKEEYSNHQSNKYSNTLKNMFYSTNNTNNNATQQFQESQSTMNLVNHPFFVMNSNSQLPTDLYSTSNPLRISNKMDQIDIDLIANQIFNRLKNLEDDKSLFIKENFNIKLKLQEAEIKSNYLIGKIDSLNKEMKKDELNNKINLLEKEKLQLIEELRLKQFQYNIKQQCNCEKNYSSEIALLKKELNNCNKLRSVFYFHFSNLSKFIDRLKEKNKFRVLYRYAQMNQDELNKGSGDIGGINNGFGSSSNLIQDDFLFQRLDFGIDKELSFNELKRRLANIENIIIRFITDKTESEQDELMSNNWYKEPERNLNSNQKNNDTNNNNNNYNRDNNRNDDETKNKNILNSCSREIDFFRERIGLNKKSNPHFDIWDTKDKDHNLDDTNNIFNSINKEIKENDNMINSSKNDDKTNKLIKPKYEYNINKFDNIKSILKKNISNIQSKDKSSSQSNLDKMKDNNYYSDDTKNDQNNPNNNQKYNYNISYTEPTHDFTKIRTKTFNKYPYNLELKNQNNQKEQGDDNSNNISNKKISSNYPKHNSNQCTTETQDNLNNLKQNNNKSNQVKDKFKNNIYKKLEEAKNFISENKRDDDLKNDLRRINHEYADNRMNFHHYTNNHIEMNIDSIDKEGNPVKSTNKNFKKSFPYMEDHVYDNNQLIDI